LTGRRKRASETAQARGRRRFGRQPIGQPGGRTPPPIPEWAPTKQKTGPPMRRGAGDLDGGSSKRPGKPSGKEKKEDQRAETFSFGPAKPPGAGRFFPGEVFCRAICMS